MSLDNSYFSPKSVIDLLSKTHMGITPDYAAVTDISLWQTKLGLLPVPLYPNERENRFVLLNGNRGNFCLDFLDNHEFVENRNRAWSADVGYYITLDRQTDDLIIQNWSNFEPEKIPVKRVLNDLLRFHRQLEKEEPKNQPDIVKHVIRVFRSLRNQMGPNFDGQASLKVFLSLLASATENKNLNELEKDKWGLSSTAIELAETLNADVWTQFVLELTEENIINQLKPDLTLMLRHASGRVFQEAHYEAIFIRQEQLRLFGLPSDPVKLGKESAGIGLHFTPPALARTLVEEALFTYGALPDQGIKIFDPACGSGEFLRETLRQLRLNGYPGNVTLVGWDVSEAACDMARFVLAWESRDYERQVTIDIRCQDSLSEHVNWLEDSDIIIMNPPFVSWQNMTSEQKFIAEGVLGKNINYRPDLSSLFIWKASQSLNQNGVIASIIPASFLDSSSNESLRRQLSETLEVRLVARLGSHLLFSSALVDAALYVGSKRKNHLNPVAFWADHRLRSNAEGLRSLRKVRKNVRNILPVVEDGYSIYEVQGLDQAFESWAPRPFKSVSLLNNLISNQFSTVESLFDVRQGVRTGKNKAFLISKDYLESLPKKERKYFRPAVVNKSIKLGFLMDSTYLFYPYGNVRLRDERHLASDVKTYYKEILSTYKAELVEKAENPNEWWNLSRARDWHINLTPKIVSTHFGDIGSFAWDESGEYVVVQGYAWFPTFVEDQKFLNQGLGLAYLAILNSNMFGELLAAVANHVGGGQWDLSKRYVNKIPFPNLTDPDFSHHLIDELTFFGKQIHLGRFSNDNDLKKLVETIYQID